MKKWIRRLILLGILGALGLLPFRSSEVSRLIPVKTVLVTRSGDRYEVDVGAGVRGAGRTLSQALRALKERITGTVFFPTAEQIIITGMEAEDPRLPETVAAVAEEPAFRPAAGLYRSPERDLDANAAGDYLSGRGTDVTVMRIRGALRMGEPAPLPEIRKDGGGYLVETP